MNKKNYLNSINNLKKPFIIYKTIKGFDLFTDFSKKTILNNKNVSRFLNQKYKDEQVRVSEIYVNHEKYKGYKLICIS